MSPKIKPLSTILRIHFMKVRCPWCEHEAPVMIVEQQVAYHSCDACKFQFTVAWPTSTTLKVNGDA